jgi:hypothetical protein
MQGDGRRDPRIHTGNAEIHEINFTTRGQHQYVWTKKLKFRGGVSYRNTYPPPPPPIVKSILRHKRQDKFDNNGKVYAIHDDLSTTDDNNYYIPGPAIAQASENDFSNDPNNEHNISCDIADGDIDSLEKLRNKHHNSDTRGDCLDDFITYHIAPELKIRP